MVGQKDKFIFACNEFRDHALRKSLEAHSHTSVSWHGVWSNLCLSPLLGVIAGGLVGLVFAVFLVAFMLYRMKKKDEGSYSLDEPKQSNGGYQKPHKQEEFYA